MKMRKAEDV